MAHPNKAASVKGNNEKLQRMTRDYGAANPSMNKAAPVTRQKSGPRPEEAVGFGAESDNISPRSDRKARTSLAANPLATYNKGGGVQARARGGRTGKKAKKGTNVNVIVAPQNSAPPPAPPIVPPSLAGGPPPMPPKPPMMGGPPPGAAGLPMAPGAPGGMPPGILPPRADGGKVDLADVAKGAAAGAVGGSGAAAAAAARRLTGAATTKAEADRAGRASGGRLTKHDFDAGAGSGEGRLEKIGVKAKDAGRPQAV